ncbi:uncharacterized protein LOC124900172 [Homo sapiens]|uniref:uncharacterized protein LOC124900172 n=1 Tax=Homo sapiens TaxID=9606 RepID=UPI001FB0ED04|nr:uncharacterized protein LOC124900172 [Homo sapiens]XP_054207341.1 uncharacterized protein LOC124900172 [Homo sapiens]
MGAVALWVLCGLVGAVALWVLCGLYILDSPVSGSGQEPCWEDTECENWASVLGPCGHCECENWVSVLGPCGHCECENWVSVLGPCGHCELTALDVLSPHEDADVALLPEYAKHEGPGGTQHLCAAGEGDRGRSARASLQRELEAAPGSGVAGVRSVLGVSELGGEEGICHTEASETHPFTSGLCPRRVHTQSSPVRAGSTLSHRPSAPGPHSRHRPSAPGPHSVIAVRAGSTLASSPVCAGSTLASSPVCAGSTLASSPTHAGSTLATSPSTPGPHSRHRHPRRVHTRDIAIHAGSTLATSPSTPGPHSRHRHPRRVHTRVIAIHAGSTLATSPARAGSTLSHRPSVPGPHSRHRHPRRVHTHVIAIHAGSTLASSPTRAGSTLASSPSVPGPHSVIAVRAGSTLGHRHPRGDVSEKCGESCVPCAFLKAPSRCSCREPWSHVTLRSTGERRVHFGG